MSDPTPEAAERQFAAADLEDIQKLTKFPPFRRYYLRRQNEELHKAEQKVLEGRELSPEKLHDALIIHDTWKEASKMIAQDEAACRSVLAQTKGEEKPEESEDHEPQAGGA